MGIFIILPLQRGFRVRNHIDLRWVLVLPEDPIGLILEILIRTSGGEKQAWEEDLSFHLTFYDVLRRGKQQTEYKSGGTIDGTVMGVN